MTEQLKEIAIRLKTLRQIMDVTAEEMREHFDAVEVVLQEAHLLHGSAQVQGEGSLRGEVEGGKIEVGRRAGLVAGEAEVAVG